VIFNNNTMKKFYVGQKVRCIVHPGETWKIQRLFYLEVVPGPKFDDICTVRGHDGNGDLLLVGYDIGEGYDKDEFQPAEMVGLPLVTYSKVMEKEAELIIAN
jgi:hypothetical protein